MEGCLTKMDVGRGTRSIEKRPSIFSHLWLENQATMCQVFPTWLYVEFLLVHLLLSVVTEKREGKGAVLTIAHRNGHE